MANELLMSDSVDPLHGTCGVSLFPRTARALIDADLAFDNEDLDSVHHFMKYVKLNSPERVLDEAKAIVEGSSELLNSEFAKFTHSIGIDKDSLAPEGKEKPQKPQERRPGLCRKRARFSLKPDTSQPLATLKACLDIDQLQDPEEFFSAFEKLENANREIQKQKGATASDLNDSSAYTNARHRRPGILGKSASYKHRFPSVLLERDDILTSSQETLQQVIQSDSGHKSHEKANVSDVEVEDIGAVGSMTNAGNKIDEILNELLSSDNKELDGGGTLFLLQERLHIKPIDLGNLSIPEFQGVGMTDFKALGERLPKGRKSMSKMSNVVKQFSGKTLGQFKEAAENLTSPTASPTPLQSPFPSLSLLRMRSSQSNQSRDPFSLLNVDLVEHKHAYSGENTDKQSNKLDGNTSRESRSEMNDESSEPAGSAMGICTLESRGSDSLIDDTVDKRLDEQIGDTDAGPCESQTDLPDEMNRTTKDCDTARTIETSILTKDPEQLEENAADTFKATQSSMEENFNTNDSTKSASTLDAHVYSSSQVEVLLSQDADPVEEDVNIQSSSVQSMNQNQLPSDELTASEEDAANMPSTILTDLAKIPETHISQKQQCKGKGRRIGSRESKMMVLRPSLAAAGTSFDSGVRRSKRIKMRPLQYWKGERFVYGHIDKRPKLVGVKCISPSKGDECLTVKSYVPDEYKEILQQAAHY